MTARGVLGLAALSAVVVWGAWSRWAERPIVRPPGVLAPAAPIQAEADDRKAFRLGSCGLTPVARFSLRARVIDKARYRLGWAAAVSPVDLVLGWGRMSDSAVLDRIEFGRLPRYCTWRVSEYPIPRAEIETCSANMHLIAADRAVRRDLLRVRPGSVVSADGLLVDVHAANGASWKTSRSRSDTGSGACEIFFVERLATEP